MYEPAEDSELLARAVEKYATGKVLDVGTGSGVLAQTAHDKGLNVTAIDIDKEVVKRFKHKPFRVLHSDRFSNVKGTFDTIVCNPPYLPQDEYGEDKRLYGGKKGYEYINEIIGEAKNHLAKHGQFLFLISTLTKPAVVEKTLLQHGYEWGVIAREKLFMEELLVYRATLAVAEPATYIGRGKRSIVYRTKRGAVKVSTKERAAKEAQLLRKANTAGIGPRYKSHAGNKLVMEYIEGEPFNTYITRTKDLAVARKALRQARALDKLGMKKQELNRPDKNVLVTTKKRVVFLDFERSIYTEKPNNVSALASWLSGALKRDVREALQVYKRTYSEQAFRRVLKHFS